MKKLLLIYLLLLACISLYAKRTFVPRYTSFICIDEMKDSLVNGNRTTLYKDEQGGMFRVAVIHETLTLQKIKYIKFLKTMADLYTLSAVFSGVSVFSTDWKQRYRGRFLTYMNTSLADIYSYNVSAEKRLAIETWLENTSDEELMIADQERGLIWFLQPGQEIRFTLQNPDVMQLRISTPDSRNRHFVQIGAGSFLRDAEVAYEDDDVYIFPIYENNENVDTTEYNAEEERYVIMDKLTADQRIIDKKEFKLIKKTRK